MNDLTTSYFSIEKSDKQADGTLMVYGKATDDSVDIDQQICDAAWLDRAMPAWFKSGGNIREQHSSIAAGVAKEYESKADGHYIMAHVVDPVSVKKVDAGVLRGFSIGIKSPRVVRDNKAANGRIIDGQIVEVSLVDRPANPNCQLVLAKSVDGESSLIQVEELTDKHADHDQSSHGGGRGGAGGAGAGAVEAETNESEAKVTSETKREIAAVGDRARDLQHELKDNNPQDDPVRDKASRTVNTARSHIERAHKTDNPKESASELKKARTVLEPAKNSLENENYHTEAGKINEMQVNLNSLASWVVRGGSKGTEADLYKITELEKHADHDQSSHGGGRGGGGGAGGGAAAEPKTPKKVVNAAITSAEDRVDSAYKEIVTSAGPKPTANPRVMDAAQMREDAFNFTNDARDHIARGNERAAAGSLREAAGRLKGEVKFKPAAQGLKDLADQVEKGFRKVKTKATDAELRKALQSALQLLSLNKSEETPMKDSIVELPTEAVGDLLKFDKIQYEAAREALANLIAFEAGEMRDGHNELQSIAHLLEAVAHLHAWYEGEEAEGEVMEENNESIELAAKAEGTTGCDCVGCKDCNKAGGCDKAICGGHKSYKEAEADEEAEKSADLGKCLQCGCNAPGSDHGLKTTNDFANTAIPAIVTTAEMYAPGETPKSAEADEAPTEEAEVVETPAETAVEEAVTENSEAPTEVDATDVEAIVEQVVKSATESLRAEIASLVAAKEVALEKSVNLESELAIAKSLAVAGGPSRTTKPLSTKINDNLTKAAIYKAKANATTDPVLAKGYKQLAEEFYSKAADSTNN
jgi:hypothetical protein